MSFFKKQAISLKKLLKEEGIEVSLVKLQNLLSKSYGLKNKHVALDKQKLFDEIPNIINNEKNEYIDFNENQSIWSQIDPKVVDIVMNNDTIINKKTQNSFELLIFVGKNGRWTNLSEFSHEDLETEDFLNELLSELLETNPFVELKEFKENNIYLASFRVNQEEPHYECPNEVDCYLSIEKINLIDNKKK